MKPRSGVPVTSGSRKMPPLEGTPCPAVPCVSSSEFLATSLFMTQEHKHHKERTDECEHMQK